MSTQSHSTIDASAVARTLVDAIDDSGDLYGDGLRARVDLPDGRAASLRIVFDSDGGIGRWDDGPHYDDVFGTFAERGTSHYDRHPGERPDGFDGRACVIAGSRCNGSRYAGDVWWQPPADVPAEALPALERQVRGWFDGDWLHVGAIVSISDPGCDDAEEALFGIDSGYPGIDGDDGRDSLREHVAELLGCAGIGRTFIDRFEAEFDEGVAVAFGRLLTHVAEHLGAPSFAADLACKGANARSLNLMADRWEYVGFEPPCFAGDLRSIADLAARRGLVDNRTA